MKKMALKVLIIALVISALIGIFIVLSGIWNNVTENIFFSAVTIFIFGLPALICSTSYEKTKAKVISLIGIITCIVSCLCFLVLIWVSFSFSEFVWKIAWTCLIMSASLGYISLLLLIETNNKWVNYIKIATCSLTGIMDLLLLFEIFSEIIVPWRLIVTIAILIVLGTMITPLLNKLLKSS